MEKHKIVWKVLDLTLHLKDGLISTDIYSKPTDSHLYLPFSSSHPPHCKRAIPYGVALRIKRNCSTDDFLQTTIVVKSCWQSCVHHFTSHLIHYSNYYLYYLGNATLLCLPLPHIQCWDCSWGFSCMISHHVVPEKSNIEKREGVISKVMLPSQHFCPGLSENNCEQLLAYNTKFTADMQLVFS